MAKPKFPKKSNDVKDAVSTPSTPLSASTTNAEQPVTASAAVSETAKKTEPKKAARKPEIVRTEARPNLVPINLEDEIRRLAYLFSERRGFEAGHETEDWLAAEHEVRQRYHQLSAAQSA